MIQIRRRPAARRRRGSTSLFAVAAVGGVADRARPARRGPRAGSPRRRRRPRASSRAVGAGSRCAVGLRRLAGLDAEPDAVLDPPKSRVVGLGRPAVPVGSPSIASSRPRGAPRRRPCGSKSVRRASCDLVAAGRLASRRPMLVEPVAAEDQRGARSGATPSSPIDDPDARDARARRAAARARDRVEHGGRLAGRAAAARGLDLERRLEVADHLVDRVVAVARVLGVARSTTEATAAETSGRATWTSGSCSLTCFIATPTWVSALNGTSPVSIS